MADAEAASAGPVGDGDGDETIAPAAQHAPATGATDAETLDAGDMDIDALRGEIDRLDAEILAAVKRRAEISRAIGRTRMAEGGTRLVHRREMAVIERYSELGQEGHTLAMLLLRLGRGRLGH